MFLKLLECIRYLARQGLPFRGVHEDSVGKSLSAATTSSQRQGRRRGSGKRRTTLLEGTALPHHVRAYVRNYKSLAISRLCARHNTTWGYTMKQDKLKPFTDDLHPYIKIEKIILARREL